jgi:hypothetical protein
MIKEDVLKEKLKYLITINSQKWFEIIEMYFEFDYVDQSHEQLHSYEIDVKFDYHGIIDFYGFYSFTADLRKMSEELKTILLEYIITQDGKIVSGEKSNCYTLEPMIFNIEYEADTKHIFNLGYKFHYTED